MNFRSRYTEEPMEINLIPLIDVLLVILIFLAASTSFTRQSQLQLDLPKGATIQTSTQAAIVLSINKDGAYYLDNNYIEVKAITDLSSAISKFVDNSETSLTIAADQQATHGSVVQALEAARQSGVEKINFLTESTP